MGKKLLFTISLLAVNSLLALAQEPDLKMLPQSNTATTVDHRYTASEPNADHEAISDFHDEASLYMPSDTLHLPVLNTLGQVQPISLYPLGWMGYYSWDLHEGLNVNFGASVFAAFGKHTPSGAGFGQNISAMYATSLTPRLSIAVGGYFSNLYWAHNSFRDGGFNAVVGYKFDEHWEGYIYGQKSIMTRRMPPLLYDINHLGDRIGAAVKYNISPQMSFMISVESGK